MDEKFEVGKSVIAEAGNFNFTVWMMVDEVSDDGETAYCTGKDGEDYEIELCDVQSFNES